MEGQLPPLARIVVIVAPHTTNWDFLIGVLAMFATGLRVTWLGKHSIFRWPLSPVLRWLGGEAIDRSAAHGTVEAAISRFQSRSTWALGLAPEGTRKRTTEWKTGFYRVAVGAGVPIVPVYLDYPNRVVGITPPLTMSGDMTADLARIGQVYRADMARYPEKFGIGSGGGAG